MGSLIIDGRTKTALPHLGGLTSHPQDRAHTYAEFASNTAHAGPLSPGRDDRRHFVRVAILQAPTAETRSCRSKSSHWI